jgi:hypothetical protein
MENKMDLGVTHLYHVECFDKDGNLKWEDGFKNIVVTVGRNYYLDAAIKTGVASPLWYVGLKNATAAVAADTMSSKGFTELVPYSDANRPAYVPGTIASGSVDNSASKAVFNINGASTIGGAFLVNNNTKGGTTGTLLGAGNFGVARAVENGDVLNVTVTCSITST